MLVCLLVFVVETAIHETQVFDDLVTAYSGLIQRCQEGLEPYRVPRALFLILAIIVIIFLLMLPITVCCVAMLALIGWVFIPANSASLFKKQGNAITPGSNLEAVHDVADFVEGIFKAMKFHEGDTREQCKHCLCCHDKFEFLDDVVAGPLVQ